VLVVLPLQTWVIRSPVANVRVTVHDVVASVPVLVNVTAPWNPPDQCPAVA
jgi:hypothetical protein